MAELKVFDTVSALMHGAANEIVSAAGSAVADHGRFSWALSGGSTPRDLYRLLASDGYRDRMPWNAIHFFWGDERHVPPDHPDSNFRMAREAMLDAVPVPPSNIHRVPAEETDASRAAAEYEATLRSFFGLGAGEWPRFDLILLGLGKDGHTASLFPGGDALNEREKLVVAPWVEAQKTFRVTFTPPVLNHALRAMFLAAGDDKAEALRAVLEGAREPERYPAQVVEGSEGNVSWWVDRAAARLLKAA
jgi:6-phosphogluconolactonase